MHVSVLLFPLKQGKGWQLRVSNSKNNHELRTFCEMFRVVCRINDLLLLLLLIWLFSFLELLI